LGKKLKSPTGGRAGRKRKSRADTDTREENEGNCESC
jgi:hypothetical protein